jgi:hypothetical protein
MSSAEPSRSAAGSKQCVSTVTDARQMDQGALMSSSPTPVSSLEAHRSRATLGCRQCFYLQSRIGDSATQHEARPRLPWPALSPERYPSRYSPRFIRHWLADWISLPMLRIQAREELRNARAFTSIRVNSLYSRESVLRAYGIDACPCYLGVDTELFVDRHQRR